MINKALQFINDVLDQFLRNRFSLDESKVILNNLIESNGAIPQINQNKIVISLINVEKETNKPFYNHNQKLNNGNYSDISVSERYNLDILISANFEDYKETLKFLSEVITFFQVNTMFDAASFSNMPSGLHRLEFDIEKINYVQMQGVWTAMGAKYQPSVIYQMRLVTIQGNEARGFPSIVSKTSNLVTT